MEKNAVMMKIVVVAIVIFALTSVALSVVAAAEYECPADAQQAYQQYMAAFNRMASLMAEGKGDTPEAQVAYQEFAKAKACYESRLSGDSGGTSGFARIKDWDESGDSFSFSLGEVCSGCWHEAPDSDFFIADRAEDSIIHVFDSPGIIDMGDIPLDDIKKAPASGYVEMATPIDGHSYVVRSKGKYGKFYLDETYDWKDPTEYGIRWVYQLNGTRAFGGAEAPGEPATPGQTVTGGEYECPQDAGEAYQQYIAAYNKLNYLMAHGGGDTPEAQAAYEAYKKAKACYESRISGTETPPTPTPTPTPSEPATPGQTVTGGEYECPQDYRQAYQWYIAAFASSATSIRGIQSGEGLLREQGLGNRDAIHAHTYSYS
jgi:TPR repeat protein